MHALINLAIERRTHDDDDIDILLTFRTMSRAGQAPLCANDPGGRCTTYSRTSAAISQEHTVCVSACLTLPPPLKQSTAAAGRAGQGRAGEKRQPQLRRKGEGDSEDPLSLLYSSRLLGVGRGGEEAAVPPPHTHEICSRPPPPPPPSSYYAGRRKLCAGENRMLCNP